jgi:protein TonB
MSFEAFLTQDQQRPKKRRRITTLISLAVHGGLLCGGVAYSFAHVDELSAPAAPVVLLRQVPPPPPPPAGAPKRTVTRTHRRLTQIVQPDPTKVVQPPEPEKKDPGGGEGPGVPGGVIGGIDIGTELPPPPPPTTMFLAPRVATGRLAIDPQDPAYQAHMPAALARAGMSLWAMVKVCVRPDGRVGDVTMLKGADPTLDPSIVAAIRTWRYHPYTVDGRPVPFCTNVRYEMITR